LRERAIMSEWGRRLANGAVDRIYWGCLKRYDVLGRLAAFRARQWDPPDVFAARQAALLSGVLAHALERIPFLAERAPGLSPAAARRDPLGTLRRFPILEKRSLEAYLASLEPERSRRAFVSSSGGSTGEPVRFLIDAAADSAGLAAERLLYEWAGVRRGDLRLLLWGARHELGGGARAFRRWLDRIVADRVILDAFDLGPEAMRTYAGILAAARPVCVDGYADALHAFASFVEAEGLSLPSPRAVVSSASTLLPHMRRTIECVFGAPVFDRYGSREIPAIAAECGRHSGLHIFGETAFVEVVDDRGRDVDEGCEGEILVTSLVNYTMPLIRYRIGDRAVRGPEVCSCGRPYPLLRELAGRSSTPLKRPDGGAVSTGALTHIVGVECNDGAIMSFQVVQEALDQITVRVVPVHGRDQEALSARREITSKIRGVMGCDCGVRFVVVDRIEPARSGKHLYVISRLGGAIE
jgi:phenylacetate-CoA ligase